MFSKGSNQSLKRYFRVGYRKNFDHYLKILKHTN